jgi:inhibitor of cysteine peptidase
MITVDQSSNNTSVSLVVGERLDIALEENPTTGFRWQLKTDGAPACVSRDSTFEVSAPGVGRGGIRRWRFEAVQAGSATIELVYRRSFEQDTPPARVFRIAVNVGK